jgi:carbonic anhydrase
MSRTLNLKKMKNLTSALFAVAIIITVCSCSQKKKETNKSENGVEKTRIETSGEALKELIEGNKRFLEKKFINTNYTQQIEQTKAGQKPHSVILSCMDSRVPPEIIFDQGIGNVFVLRVAGNVEDDNILGSLEYAIEHAESKLIVIMAHSHCGAVTGAVKDVKEGNLTQLLDQIKPAIKSDPSNPNIVDETAKNSVKITIKDIMDKSDIIREVVHNNTVAIVAAFYDIETGIVTFE